MIYTLKLKLWMDHHIQINKVQESSFKLKPKPNAYKELMKELFMEYHTNHGMAEEEAEDLFNGSDFMKIENWMQKKGFTFEDESL